MSMTPKEFIKALREPYAWPGGYPRFFICSDGGVLSYKAARENVGPIRRAIKSGDGSGGWRVVAVDINWEDNDLVCDHTGEKIESAYGENNAA